MEWLIYAPRVIDFSIYEHGQSDERRSSHLRKSDSDTKREKLAQFKYILREYDIAGKESISFLEFIKWNKDNINSKDSRQRTKINIAAKEGHYLVVKQLLEWGADPNIYDKDKFTALGLSVREGHDDISKLLLQSWINDNLEYQVELNKGAGYLGSPLHISVVKHKIDIVQSMIKWGADINALDSDGNTPLHQLISIYSKNEFDSYKLLKLLIKNEANWRIKNNTGLTPFLIAIKRKQKGGIRDILKEINPKEDNFDMNAIEKSSGLNGLYLLFKQKLASYAEETFLKGGNSLLYIPGGWKRWRYDEESFKSKYLIRKMRKFQLRKKFKVERINTLEASETLLKRNRIDHDEGNFKFLNWSRLSLSGTID